MDKFKDRRQMPRLVLPKNLPSPGQTAILASCNLDYFIKYGLLLIDSVLKYTPNQPIIINCVEFSFSVAINIIKKYFHSSDLSNLYLTKTQFNGSTTLEQKDSYLKTIRYYVGESLQNVADLNLLIIDVDAMIVKHDFSDKLNEIKEEGITFGVGATYDYLKGSLYEAGRKNYLWRTVKAGLSFFSEKEQGKLALKKVVSCLFNNEDTIPPLDKLKLYRAYYGDQFALFMTSLELNGAPKQLNHKIKCIGPDTKDIVSFSKREEGSIWIPPARYRYERLFDLNNIN